MTSPTFSFRIELRQQYQVMRQQAWLTSLLTWLPAVGFMLIWGIFSSGLARELPVAIVDLDHSQLSRRLINDYDASPTLAMRSVSDENEGRALMRQGKVYGLVIIPHDLAKDTKRGLAPSVAAYYNAQFLVAGKLINAALQQSHGNLNAQISVVSNLANGDTQTVQALAAAMPIQSQAVALYNSNNSYAQFLVSAIFPAFWQVLIMVVTVLSFGSEIKEQGMAQYIARHPWQKISAKLLFFGGLLWLQGLLMCGLMYGVFDWPMRGSWSLLLLTMTLCLLASQAIAVLFVLLFDNISRALSFAGALTAPSLAFMGITFPVANMYGFAQFWRSLIPITHFIEMQVSQANYGLNTILSLAPVTHLLGFSVVFIAIFGVINLRKSKANQEQVS